VLQLLQWNVQNAVATTPARVTHGVVPLDPAAMPVDSAGGFRVTRGLDAGRVTTLSLQHNEFVPGRGAHRCSLLQHGTEGYIQKPCPAAERHEYDKIDLIWGKFTAEQSEVTKILDKICMSTTNISTLHPRELRQSGTKHACGSTARMLLLDYMFWRGGAHLVCVQECRIPDDGEHSGCHNKMYRVGASVGGSYGLQIWVAHNLAEIVTIVEVCSPRLHRVVLQLDPFFIHALSGHAAIEAA
jgi:hypothetical protein